MNGFDTFISLPTGFGKSIIFQCLPLCCDYINTLHVKQSSSSKTKSLAIVVLPLKSLAVDQVKRAEALGIEAAAMIDEVPDDVMEKACQGGYSILFSSPEALLSTKGKELLQATAVYNRVCGLFVDESHCVVKWGQSSGNTGAFRKLYGLLAELRSILKLKTPVAAMTATAAVAVRGNIIRSLGMQNVMLIDINPVLNNIKHVVSKTSLKDCADIFGWLCDEVSEKKERADRIIIFCQSRKDCSELYSVFCSKLPPCLHKHFNMYHTNTENDQQKQIATEFADVNGTLRILFATIAFGLGVDVKGVHTTIMYGPPQELDVYLQLCGRGGRDGEQSLSVIVKTTIQTGRSLSKDMQAFLKAANCRRDVLKGSFPGACDNKKIELHNCCDNCHRKCTCLGTFCTVKVTFLEEKLSNLQTVCEAEVPVIAVSDDQYEKIQRDLKKLQEEKLSTLLTEHIYSGTDVASTLPSSTISQILQNLHLSFSYSQFSQMYTFPNMEVSEQVWAFRTRHLSQTLLCDHNTVPSLIHSDTEEEDYDEDDQCSPGSEYAKIVLPSSESD